MFMILHNNCSEILSLNKVQCKKESSIYAGSKQICLMRGNDFATDFPYSMNEITL